MDRKLKHLEFVQGTINRLSTNSFLLKGWSVVIVSALFVLSGSESDGRFAYYAALPATIIWGLDGYFLWQERKYRDLYNTVRSKEPSEVDFSMATHDYSAGFRVYLAVTFSKTLVPFHGAIIGAIALVACFVR